VTERGQGFPHSLSHDASALVLPTHVQKPINVSLEYFGRITDALRMLVLNRDTGACVDIVATVDPDHLLSIITHLRTAISLRTASSGRSTPRAAFSRCFLTPPTPGQSAYELVVEVRWTLGLPVVEDPSVAWAQMSNDLQLLSAYFHDADADTHAKWELSDFYDSVHVPSPDMKISPCIQLGMTEASLYPFQQRTVDWLLRREGVAYLSTSLEPFIDNAPPPSFKRTTDALGNPCHVSQLRGLVVANQNDAPSGVLESLRGGILAEEMGLGKTVELIALITHHKRNMLEGTVRDAYTGADVKPSGATLIITPPTILDQWIGELHTHAPELKVFHYRGIPKQNAPKEELAAATVDNLMRYDVVLTTYNVLAREIHFAASPPDRSLRNVQRHERRKSPLVEISWWRVCLDEAQMVESGVSKAATVARIIPRCNAWAVSGTPLRKDVQDLRGLLIFLRCDAFANNKALWNSQDKAAFRGIFNQIALRHNKDKIRTELHLPPQRRAVITVSFTAIEEQNYNDMFRQMSDACWLTEEGQPKPGFLGWDHPTVVERMREWLVRLRQTCLHAHVGGKNKKALGGKNAPLRTIDEVLEVMMEQNDTNWKAEVREMILDQIKRGHIKAYAGDVKNRAKTALPYYEEALQHTQAYLSRYREELLLEHQKIGTTASRYYSLSADVGKDLGEEHADEDEDLGRIPMLSKSLRSFRELEHACNFFIATTYHQMNEYQNQENPESGEFLRLQKLETEWYEKAKVVRRELLTQPKIRAQQHMSDINAKKPFYQIPTIDDLPDLGGIESRKFLDMMDKVSDFLNAQLEQIQVWREKIVELLLMRLVDDDGDEDGLETTGEEYDDSLKAQDELYVYIMGLRTLVADRNSAISGLHDLLVNHELKYAVGLTKEDNESKRGHAPELVIEIAEVRRKLLGILEGGSLKGVASGIRGLIMTLQWRAESDTRAVTELDIANKQLLLVQKIISQQTKATAELEKEMELFRSTMNLRLEYYRQFQHISDTVEKWKNELDEAFNEREFQTYSTSYERRKNSVAALKTKSAYLAHLQQENLQESSADCIICQDQIEIGVLTTCGHKVSFSVIRLHGLTDND
jgi:E3 ubiquitin-protein ligase SHPRH